MVKNLCSHEGCNKKLYLTQLIIGTCRCGGYFCNKHRLNHNCTYDYSKERNKEQFVKDNLCIHEKILKI